MSDETTPILTRKVFDSVETHFVPGERSMVAWISTDSKDHERDVVVASGVDFKTYFLGKTPEEGNPCVLALHDLGKWPLGQCKWIKVKQGRGFTGLYAMTVFDDDEAAETVWRKIKSGTLKGISIGFRPPDDLKPGEWGPPTREELLRRPDWKGVERVIRRCVLLEYSVCSIGMNPQALVAAVNKGLHKPNYSTPKAPDMPEPEETPVETEAIETKAAKPAVPAPCECGEKDCKCSEGTVEKTKEPPEDEPESEPASSEEAAALESEESDEDDFNEDDETELPIKTRDHVDVKQKGFRGCGMVEKIHRRGLVDHVDEDVRGTKDDPAARVRLYKAHGDGHAPSEQRIGAKLKDLTKRAEPFRTPSKKSLKAIGIATTPHEDMSTVATLPPLLGKSDQQIATEAIERIEKVTSPEFVIEQIEKLFGCV